MNNTTCKAVLKSWTLRVTQNEICIFLGVYCSMWDFIKKRKKELYRAFLLFSTAFVQFLYTLWTSELCHR